MLLALAPGFLPLPRKGDTVVQPLWIEDLTTCLVWALDDPATVNQTYDVGGSEFLTLRQVVETVMAVTGQRRWLVSWPAPLLRAALVVLESVFPRFPVSVFLLDYLAVNRTCPVDTIPLLFGLMPARFASRLDYLRGGHWGGAALRTLFVRHA